MTFYQKRCTAHLPERQSGVSLIIVLIMLVIIGLTSAAAIRNATSGEKVTNNIRLQNLAQQYADAALRFCEGELSKPDGVLPADGGRVASLAAANILPYGSDGWNQSGTWTGVGGASASLTVLPVSQVMSIDSTFQPSKLPECVVEAGPVTDSFVVTARGFSTDYAADSTSGKTTNGSVVWLQSTVLIQ